MRYEIKIDGAQEASGSVNLNRLALLAESIQKIAEGSLQIRLRGISLTRGRKKLSLKNALNINLTGLKNGSTVLNLDCAAFSETLEPVQMDIFKQENQRDLPGKTPISLLIESFQEALKEEPSSDVLDKPLLHELKNFRKAFLSDSEVFTITNEGTVETLKLKKETFTKVKNLEDNLPDPQPVILNGKVELLQYSKQKVIVQTKEGLVNGFLSDDIDPEEIAGYWGKEITIAGTMHHKPGSKFVIEINRVSEPDKEDHYFSRKPKSETVEQQIQRQLREGKKPNALGDLVGQWPGNETEEEFEKMLKRFHQ